VCLSANVFIIDYIVICHVTVVNKICHVFLPLTGPVTWVWYFPGKVNPAADGSVLPAVKAGALKRAA
jgi:hypothetical protein